MWCHSVSLTDNSFLPDYAFPYIILVLSLVTLAVYMSASEVEVSITLLLSMKKCNSHFKKENKNIEVLFCE